jgi:diguanylate cyclase
MIILYAIFSTYYFNQREVTAKIISSSIKNDLSELSYVLSKHIRKESVTTARALIDRKSANNNYINAIAIFDNETLLLTTDPQFSVLLTSSQTYLKPHQDTYNKLMDTLVFQDYIYYYEGKNQKSFTILFLVDQQFLHQSFTQARTTFLFLFLFLFIPIFTLLFFWIVISKLIINPLEMLRQYAYYHERVPKAFKIHEIEYIRSSMVQTFSQLEQERKELYNISRTDTLSGLANRDYLQERVEQIIEQCNRTKKEFALLFLDLDHFKSVNDSLGHDIGDELLKSVAATIQDVVRLNDVVARIGGDEFVIVLTEYKDDLELVEIIHRIQTQLMKPWQIKTFPINITSSIGITLYPKDGTDLLTLMKNADIAMYEAKEKGRKGYHFFTETLNIKTQEYIEITNSMINAVTNNEYELFYQPQNSVSTGEIIGAEALIRWNHPDKGLISPVTFIPIAEHSGYIVDIGKWVLQTALKQKETWENEGIDIKLSINVAAKQILEKDFIEHLQSLLNQYQINRKNIFLEITEYIFIHDSDAVLKTFQEIKAMGIKISLDDFGTGYSSLSYLKTFPMDVLKIDKVFLDDYSSEEGSIFIKTIINMAQTLSLKVVAEGVETQEQALYLKELRCDFFQGYYCSKPLPVKEFSTLYNKELSY